MDLISRKLVIDRLETLQNEYRTDTDIGNSLRNCVGHAIDLVRVNENFTFKHIGHSELKHFMQLAQERMELLTQEKTIEVFAITGLYSMRYTLEPSKAKTIFLEEANRINQDDGITDFLDESLKIGIKKVRESDLPQYNLES